MLKMFKPLPKETLVQKLRRSHGRNGAAGGRSLTWAGVMCPGGGVAPGGSGELIQVGLCTDNRLK